MLDPWNARNTAANDTRATERRWHARSTDNHSRHTGNAADALPVPVGNGLLPTGQMVMRIGRIRVL